MSGLGRRFSSAYEGPEPPAWTAHLEYSARILRLAGFEIEDKALLARVEREDHERKNATPRDRRRTLPDFRKHPPRTEAALFAVDFSRRFKFTENADIRLERFRVFPNGVSFQLVGRQPGPEEGQGIATGNENVNLSGRMRPGQQHRIRLVVSVDPRHGSYGFHGGTTLHNAAEVSEFPDDPESFWLAGGSDRRGLTREGDVEFAASYFLSPAPTKGTVIFTIGYPEFDIEPTSISLSASKFALKTD